MTTLKPLRIEREDRPGQVRLVAVGRVDMHTAPDFRQRLVEVLHHGDQVVVDLAGLHQLDSLGVGIVIDAARRLRDRGGALMVVCAAGSRVAQALSDAGIDRLAAVVNNPAE